MVFISEAANRRGSVIDSPFMPEADMRLFEIPVLDVGCAQPVAGVRARANPLPAATVEKTGPTISTKRSWSTLPAREMTMRSGW